MNHLLYLVLKKSGLNKLLYNATKNKWHEFLEINDQSVSQARMLLASLQPDPQNSCICENKIVDSPIYDLQIIVPAYNVKQYIKECIDSILTQDTSFRYIVKVINDGSTDNTPHILNTYKHRPEIKIINQNNRGFSGARNTGLNNIEARYVMFLDADDRLAPGAIHTLLQMAYNNDADIVEGSYIKFCGPFITKKYHHTNCKKTIENSLFGFAWGKIYKASLFRNIKFPERYWFEDTLCSFLLHSLANQICTISHQVYCYRTNFKGISRNFRGKVKCIDSFYICEQLLTDRIAMGLTIDNSWSDKIAKQCRLNSNRVSSLKREDINRALFILQSSLFRKLFTNTLPHTPLAQALLTGDYKAFKLQMKWL